MNALQSLGINLWSIVLHLVNIGALFFVLARYLYRPLLSFLDKRREIIRQNVQEAERLRLTFEHERVKREQETEQMLQRMRTELREVQARASQQAKELLTEAEQKRNAMLEDAHRQVEEMKNSMMKETEAMLLARIEKIVLHILRNDVSEATVKKSASTAWNELFTDSASAIFASHSSIASQPVREKESSRI